MDYSLVWPFLFMMGLTFMYMPISFLARYTAVKNGRIRLNQFKLMEIDYKENIFVAKTTRQFTNLFEIPVLFYALILAALVLKISSPLLVGLAWSFIVLRVLQGFIHLTYNKVTHRLFAFMGANFCLILFLIFLLQEIMKRPH
jgi:hypothetical protein